MCIRDRDTVADHGSYTAVRNMTTSDAVEQSGDTVTVHVAEDGKLYYEAVSYTHLHRRRAGGSGRERRHAPYQGQGVPLPQGVSRLSIFFLLNA